VAKEEAMKMDGKVIEVLGNAMFRVQLDNAEHVVTAYIGGKMRTNQIKIVAGDSVILEMSPYDLTKGRIMRRK